MAKARAAMGDWFGILPEGRLRRRGDHQRRDRLLLPAAQGRQPRRRLLHEHVRPDRLGPLRDRGDLATTRASPATTSSSRSPAELETIPEFRKRAFIAAYGEGWGLYTERLADEMGLYSTPLDRMGMLAADSMRACRLVVDTGMHALGWSRQQAIDYMVANSPMRPCAT